MSTVKNIIVFGSHGKIGQQFVRLLADKTSVFRGTAVVRNDEQATTIKSITANSLTVGEIASAIKGHDAVVFTVGSAGKNLLQVDLDAAVKTFEASVEAQVRRFIIISALHADNREFFSKLGLRNYYIAKHYADRILVDEFSDKLDYTILKPTSLSDDAATGKIRIIKSTDEEIGTITRADVAKVIYEIVNDKDTFGKSYNIANGDLDIRDKRIYKSV
ncbi:NADH(P)-binding family protein [Candida albicans]|uniref:NADH(P)-binding family protein n=1 Tax=Candida albicans TaxID=5476 RepID=A0A8H6F575_CANAX|nr:NADH(P)-binding family protein [Candida albicans]